MFAAQHGFATAGVTPSESSRVTVDSRQRSVNSWGAPSYRWTSMDHSGVWPANRIELTWPGLLPMRTPSEVVHRRDLWTADHAC